MTEFEAAVEEMVAMTIPREKAIAAARLRYPEQARPAAAIEADDARLEKAVVANADKQMRALGFRVINTSQPRHAKFLTLGIADRIYFHRKRGIAIWWEAKTESGVQSPAQRDFQEDCDACGWPYVIGTDQVLFAWMVERGIAVRGDDGLLYTPSNLVAKKEMPLERTA